MIKGGKRRAKGGREGGWQPSSDRDVGPAWAGVWELPQLKQQDLLM